MPGIDVKPNTIRVRQNAQTKYDSFATKDIGGGISLVLGIKSGKSETQSVIFDKKQFPDAESVKSWIKNHGQYHMREIEDCDKTMSEKFTGEIKLGGEDHAWQPNEILREGFFINSSNGRKITVTEKTIDNINMNDIIKT